ncbi:MAG: type I pullulanase, partial [Corynebacterium sp.]|nr:type I pullulanase [Corynebacterium sp.]
IKDACIYFVEQFDIDGYRFDLMGITDIKTMNEIRDELIKIKPNIFLYGEGWNMACGIEESERATMQNHKQLPGYAYFNDHFRNEVGGKLDGSDLGILEPLPQEVLDDVMNGSPSIFDNPNQSINYVECHDNYALADKLEILGLGVKEAYHYIEATIKAKGHPFLQIGQSFFRNKQGVENSYKSPDEINMIRWEFLDKHSELNQFTKELILNRTHNVSSNN